MGNNAAAAAAMSLFSSISGFISNAIVGGDSQGVHLPSAPAPLADVMSTASAMTSAFFADNKPPAPPAAAAAKPPAPPAAAAKPPPSPTPAAQPPPPVGSRDRVGSTPSRPPSTSSLSESAPASRTGLPGRPTMPPPPPGKAAAVDDGPDLGPEFSHLSAEERRQIQMVMARAAQMTGDRQKGYAYFRVANRRGIQTMAYRKLCRLLRAFCHIRQQQGSSRPM